MAIGVINAVSRAAEFGSGLGSRGAVGWDGEGGGVLTAALLNVIFPLTNYNY